MDDASSARRTRARYITLLLLVVALIGGWSAFWFYASGKIGETLDAWREREAKSGRVYACGSQSVGGYPFRFELDCDQVSATFSQPPIELKGRGVLVAAQVYQPNLLISEFHGPLTVATPGQPADIVVNWKLAQASVSGTPSAPERVSVAVDLPVIDRISGGSQQTLLRARHVEVHGRIAEGSARDHPTVEAVLRLNGAVAPQLHPGAANPVDADINAVLRGLKDFAPKPWAERFREIQAAGGGIDIGQARLQQGDTLAVGAGSLSINAEGRLDGQLRVTIVGLEGFLNAIGAQQMVQTSPALDKLAGVLDRISPGLGGAARQQVGANLSAGINMLGEKTTLEGKPAVTLPLKFSDGAISLGPIPLGRSPALF